jgi:GAF domain-containing protein
MVPAPLPGNEVERLAALRRLQILDTGPEKIFDDLTLLASYISQTPIALISLVDKERQWFKSRIGLDVEETSRDASFCAHAILNPELLIVPDTLQDARFFHNPLVLEAPNIRFYAGAPLQTAEGFSMGTLCVIDRSPRNLSEGQKRALEALARQASELIEFRRTLIELKEALGTIKLLGGLLPICAWCKKIRDENGTWTLIEEYIQQHSEADFSHGICPECTKRVHPNYTSKK